MRKSRRKPSPWDSAVPARSKRGSRSSTGEDESFKATPPAADVTIICSSDASEWDTYLTDCLNHCCLKPSEAGDANSKRLSCLQFKIHHEKIEDIPVENLSPTRSLAISRSKVTLFILSPDFVDYIESHPNVYEVCKLLKPSNTVAMLCGVRERDIGSIHRAALVSYDSWHRLVAKDQDKDFVISVVNAIRDLLTSAEETSRLSQKPRFKITPRKVKEGHNKVFVLLDEPLDPTHKVQVFLEGDSTREVSVKKRNPYTLQFLVPEMYLKVSKLLNVHVRSQGTLLGVHLLKVDSLMGELSAILSAIDSPYELICRTLGMESRHQVDDFLVDKFNQRLPGALKADWLLGNVGERAIHNSTDELPTLLHFAACYGLKSLLQAILECPGGQEACAIRNARGLTPVQLANYGGHNEIAALLEDKRNISLKYNKASRHIGRNLPQEPSGASFAFENRTYVNVPPEIEESEPAYDIPMSRPRPVVPPRPTNLSPAPKPKIAKPVMLETNEPSSEIKSEPKPEDPETSTKKYEDRPESMYLDMTACKIKDDLPPHQLLLHGQLEIGQEKSTESTDAAQNKLNEESDEVDHTLQPNIDTDFCQNVLETLKEDCEKSCTTIAAQEELIKLIEGFKMGRAMSLIQKDFDDWKIKNNAESSIEELKKMEKNTPIKKKTPFGFMDFFLPSKSKSSKMPKETSSSKLNINETAENEVVETSTINLPSKMLDFDDDSVSRPISTLSSASSCNSRASTVSSVSSVSVGSIYDSGNHSDSCDEGLAKFKSNLTQCLTRSASALSNSRKISVSKRPPAPPPRQYNNNKNSQPNITVNPEYMESDYEVPIGMNPSGISTTERKGSLPSKMDLSDCKPITDTTEESCYWIPPPPIPIWQKNKLDRQISEDIYVEAEPDYDIPRSDNILTSSKPELDYDVPKSHYVYPPSNLPVSGKGHLPIPPGKGKYSKR